MIKAHYDNVLCSTDITYEYLFSTELACTDLNIHYNSYEYPISVQPPIQNEAALIL